MSSLHQCEPPNSKESVVNIYVPKGTRAGQSEQAVFLPKSHKWASHSPPGGYRIVSKVMDFISLLRVGYSVFSTKHALAAQDHLLPVLSQMPTCSLTGLGVQSGADLGLPCLQVSIWTPCWTSQLLADTQKLSWMDGLENSSASAMQIYSALIIC